jgi:LAS superfamily LD-carboxypeptidase LdcB
MTAQLSAAQLTGRVESHLVELPCGHRLQPAVAEAFATLQTDAGKAGFELAIASSFRSYDRQLAIWNGKASGQRAVHDDAGHSVVIDRLAPKEQLRAILRYSALPGSSRHHWGTDLDVFDASAIESDYQLQLSPLEVAPGGVFDPLHCWLDQRMAAGASGGFYRPYRLDRGGVAPERWHLSYAPLSAGCERQITADLLLACWDDCPAEDVPLLLSGEVRANLSQIVLNYVSVAPDWCPAQYRA